MNRNYRRWLLLTEAKDKQLSTWPRAGAFRWLHPSLHCGGFRIPSDTIRPLACIQPACESRSESVSDSARRSRTACPSDLAPLGIGALSSVSGIGHISAHPLLHTRPVSSESRDKSRSGNCSFAPKGSSERDGGISAGTSRAKGESVPCRRLNLQPEVSQK